VEYIQNFNKTANIIHTENCSQFS